MNALLTPEQRDGIKRQQRAWDSEFQVRGSAPKLCLQDFCAMHANVTRLLRDREAIAERIESIINERLAPYSEKQYGKGELRALVTAIRGEK